MEKNILINKLFEKGILVSADFLDKDLDNFFTKKNIVEEDLIVINSDYAEIINQQDSLVDWYELDRYRVDVEKERDEELYQNELQNLKKTKLILETPSFVQEQKVSGLETELKSEQSENDFLIKKNNLNDQSLSMIQTHVSNGHSISSDGSVEIIVSYENKPHKYKVKDFTNIFISRYRFLESVLRNHQKLQNILTINRVLEKREKELVSIIGLVEEIRTTKNGHLMVTLEDLTGKIKVLISKNNEELFSAAKELVLDEVIGIVGTSNGKLIFSENLIWPDIPEDKGFKKSEKEEYAIFLSDIHFGSKEFLKKEFKKFLSWINGNTGNLNQQKLSQKIKYIFIAGDLVDGVGEYPSQEEDLEIKDIIKQYEGVTNLIKQIPKDKQIIICPGNHDLVHLAEPQPIFYNKYTPTLLNLPNVTFVTNPSLVNIGKTKAFNGFDVLLYHGYCFDYYVANVEPIRNKGGYHRADLIMKFLLKRRHLAPSFKSTPYFPAHDEDPLLIKRVPDFFITGHIHYSKVANYKGITMICGSCWQSKTSFQEKLGHEPEPARVPIVNLKTRDIKILKFI